MTKTLTAQVPAKLQLDGWWLDHDARPFPKRIIAVKVASKGVKA